MARPPEPDAGAEAPRPTALVRRPAADPATCELTHRERAPVTLAETRAQHAGYVEALAALEGGDVLRVGRRVLVPASAPRTADRLDGLGLRAHPAALDAFERMEAGPTCLSLLLGVPTAASRPRAGRLS